MNTQTFKLKDFNSYVETEFHTLERDGLGFRLWNRQLKFGTSTDHSDYMKWLDVAHDLRDKLDEINSLINQFQEQRIKYFIVLAAGSSAVANDLYGSSLSSNVFFISSTKSKEIDLIETNINLNDTMVIYISGSGTSFELHQLFEYFWNKMHDLIGNKAANRFIAVTNKDSKLFNLATKFGFLRVIIFDSSSWGRFRALDYPGLLPARLLGLDPILIQRKVDDTLYILGYNNTEIENPAIKLGVALTCLYRLGYDVVLIDTQEPFKGLGKWIAELFAESTGKFNQGIMPILVEDSYFNSRHFQLIDVPSNYFGIQIKSKHDQQNSPQSISSLKSLPIIEYILDDITSINEEVIRWCFAIVTFCEIALIDPFVEPDLDDSFQNAQYFLQSPSDLYRYYEEISKKVFSFDEMLKRLKHRSCVVLLSFLEKTNENQKWIDILRSMVNRELNIHIIVYEGPQYLHSFGQIFKGGKDVNSYLVVTEELFQLNERMENILNFHNTILALAAGDVKSLTKRNRAVYHLHLNQESKIILESKNSSAY